MASSFGETGGFEGQILGPDAVPAGMRRMLEAGSFVMPRSGRLPK